MNARADWLARSMGVIAFIVIPGAVHVAAQTERGTTLAAILIAIQAALVMWIVLSLTGGSTIRFIGSIAAFLLALAVSRFAPRGTMLSSAVPHALIYLALLGGFTASLM